MQKRLPLDDMVFVVCFNSTNTLAALARLPDGIVSETVQAASSPNDRLFSETITTLSNADRAISEAKGIGPGQGQANIGAIVASYSGAPSTKLTQRLRDILDEM